MPPVRTDPFPLCGFFLFLNIQTPEKTADLSRRHQWLPRVMTSEKWAQKFYTDDKMPAVFSGYIVTKLSNPSMKQKPVTPSSLADVSPAKRYKGEK